MDGLDKWMDKENYFNHKMSQRPIESHLPQILKLSDSSLEDCDKH